MFIVIQVSLLLRPHADYRHVVILLVKIVFLIDGLIILVFIVVVFVFCFSLPFLLQPLFISIARTMTLV